MKISGKRPFVGGAAAGALLLGLFMLWYSWGATPLSADEIDVYMTEMAAQPEVFENDQERAAMRSFLEADDGRPFYTINLYAFHDRADYSSETGFEGSGREAYDRFSAVMVRLLASRASHPIFGTAWLEGDGDWDRLVIVRYRSRRDIAAIYASPEFALASVHKYAAIDANARMLAQGLHIPGGLLFGLVMALFFGLIVQGLLKLWIRRSARTRNSS